MKVQYLFCLCLLVLSSCSDKNSKESAEFFNRANYHYKKNEFEKALGFYNESIEKTPDFADAFNNRGVLYEKTGDLQKALKDYEKAMLIDDKFYEAKLNFARLNSELGDARGSKLVFDQLAIIYKDSTNYYNYVGQNEVRLQDFSKAELSFNKAIELFGLNYEAITNLGYLFYVQKKYNQAEENFNKALKIKPNFGFALNNLALVLEKKSELTNAMKYANLAFETDNNNLIFLNNYVFMLLNQKNVNLELAESLIKKSLNIEPENPYSLRNFGIFQLLSKKTQSSFESFLKAEKIDPGTEYIYYYLGLASMNLNNISEACKYFTIGNTLKDSKSLLMSKKCN